MENDSVERKDIEICAQSSNSKEEIIEQGTEKRHHFEKCSNYDDELKEQQHFFDIINTYRYYKNAGFKRIMKRVDFIKRMSKSHQEKLKGYCEHLEKLQLAVSHNYEVIKIIIGDAAKMFKNVIYSQSKENLLVVKSANELDVSRIDSVLNQIVREWCVEGSSERAPCFNAILDALEEHYKFSKNRHLVKILVPGAGLGRLAFEIAKRGFSCQGNEFSLMMLIVSNFILNKCREANLFTIYPWVSHFSNNLLSEHQITSVTFPDVNPTTIPDNLSFSMVAGSFTEIYNSESDKESFDCITTCFFIDTAPNIVAYIETIHNILKPGGIWINFGPLLYHYADMPDSSIEPSYEIVREIIISFGFKFLTEQTNVPSYYTKNPNSMVTFQYSSVFFLCQKL